jgi:predicted dehydrogenase
MALQQDLEEEYMDKENRRIFMKKLGAASALTAGGLINWNPRALGANEKVVLALIGGRNQGRGDALRAIQRGGEFKTFCDIDQAILDRLNPELEKAQGKKPETTRDFMRVLDDKDIDGVMIATPDHWHARIAMLACQAGKDVYIEKPLTQTIDDGKMVVQAARKYKRIAQMGTQNRSMDHFTNAFEYLKSGKIGKLCEITVAVHQVRETIGNPPDSEPPATVDYDQWLGPAPQRPFNKNRFHYNWRFFWDYGNTELGNQGVHSLDVAMWGIATMRGGIQNILPTHVSGHSAIYWLNDAKEVPDTQALVYDFGDFMLTWELRSFFRERARELVGAASVSFHGSEALLMVGRSGWKVFAKDGSEGPGEMIDRERSPGAHEKNFMDCIKSRQQPNADVEIGRLSTMICHLGNICTRLKRDIVFDPKTETFGHDKEANAYLTKEHRKPYILPKV